MLIPLVQIFHISDEHVSHNNEHQKWYRKWVFHSRLATGIKHLIPSNRFHNKLQDWEDALGGHDESAAVAFTKFLEEWQSNPLNMWHNRTESNDVLISTGDNTTWGDDQSFKLFNDYWAEWQTKGKFQQAFKLYGNHDLWNNGHPINVVKNIDIQRTKIEGEFNYAKGTGLKAEILRHRGYKQEIELAWLDTNAADRSNAIKAIGEIHPSDEPEPLGVNDTKKFRILLTHHPFVLPPGQKKGFTKYLNNADLHWRKTLPTAGIHLSLCGHEHKTYTATGDGCPDYGPVKLAQFSAGSLMSATSQIKSNALINHSKTAQILQIYKKNDAQSRQTTIVVRRFAIARMQGSEYVFLQFNKPKLQCYEDFEFTI